MLDQLQREIDYIRISVTDRCNLRCIYCMPQEGVPFLPHEEILTFEEIERIVKVLAENGFKKIKITGGEPLVRKGCTSLIANLKQIRGIEKVTITTNGVLLAEQMDTLAKAGIDGINLSLDTLDPEGFRTIAGRDSFDRVMAGMERALNYGEIPLKINCVPTKENADQILKIADLARTKKVHVRFIEMMPIGMGASFHGMREQEILELLEERYGAYQPYEKTLGNGPGHYYSFEGFEGKIGFISAMSHKFCHKCNRVRLTADGFFKVCLQYPNGISLKQLLRNGCTDEELAAAIQEALLKKPEGHHFNEEKEEKKESLLMAQIGG